MWQQKRQERVDTQGHQPQNEIISHLKTKLQSSTGGRRGIGFAVARMPLAEGMRVAISARNEKKLSRAPEELKKEANGEE